MERRKPKEYSDIGFKEVFLWPVIIVVLATVLLAAFGAANILPGDGPEEATAYNELVTEFNAWPREQRELVCAIAKHEAATTLSGQMKKDLMLKLEDVPEKSKLDEWKELLPIASVTVIVLFFIAVVFFYWMKADNTYYFCDLPLDTAYGWFLLLMLLPAGWLFLLASWRRMRAAEKGVLRTLRILNGEEKWPDKESLTMEKPLRRATYRKQAKDDFVKMRTKNSERREEKLKEAVEEKEDRLRSYSAEIVKVQRSLGKAQAKLREFQTTKPSEDISRSEALAEWDQLLQMRGVTRVSVENDKEVSNSQFVAIIIKARVPYEGILYDFGDYEVRLYSYGDFEINLLRSGAIGSGVMLYETRKGFCFGDRYSEIKEYMSQGRILEAMTLIVDSLHTVNPESEHKISGRYRRVKLKK